MKNYQLTSASRYLPLATLALVAFFLSLTDMRVGDAIGYTFLVSADPDFVSNEPLNNISDLLTSQCNHYVAVNGRFFVHIIVQLFCAFLPAWLFAMTNACVNVAIIIEAFKLAGIRRISHVPASVVWLASAIFIIVIRPTDFQPPMLINYIWVGFLMLLTLRLFLFSDTKSLPGLAGLALLAFLTGEGNEAFSIPLAVLFLGYACVKRFRLSAAQWVMGPSFAIGTLILCLAPGNFVRLSDTNVSSQPFFYAIESFLISAIPFLIWGFLRLLQKKPVEKIRANDTLWWLVALSFAFCFALRFTSGVRMSVPAALALMTLSLPLCFNLRFRKPLVSASVIIAALVVNSHAATISRMKEKYHEAVYNVYPTSPSGRVYLPDDLFCYRFREHPYTTLYFSRQRQVANPSAPDLMLLPEIIRTIPRDLSLDTLIQLDNNSWFMVQSRTNPAKFILHKRIGFGAISHSLSPKELNFNADSDIVFDSTTFWKAAVYVNDRPYIIPEITIEHEDSVCR